MVSLLCFVFFYASASLTYDTVRPMLAGQHFIVHYREIETIEDAWIEVRSGSISLGESALSFPERASSSFRFGRLQRWSSTATVRRRRLDSCRVFADAEVVAVVHVRLRWTKEQHDLRLDLTDTVGDLKSIIWSLTNVVPHRQKLLGLTKSIKPLQDETTILELGLLPNVKAKEFMMVRLPLQLPPRRPLSSIISFHQRPCSSSPRSHCPAHSCPSFASSAGTNHNN